MKWDKMDERARNYFLAENVMGWPVGGREMVGAGLIPSAAAVIRNWHPTTDIIDAMQLLEVMRGKGWDWRLDCLCTLQHAYSVTLTQPRNYDSKVGVCSATLPDAIAHACFLALGGENE